MNKKFILLGIIVFLVFLSISVGEAEAITLYPPDNITETSADLFWTPTEHPEPAFEHYHLETWQENGVLKDEQYIYDEEVTYTRVGVLNPDIFYYSRVKDCYRQGYYIYCDYSNIQYFSTSHIPTSIPIALNLNGPYNIGQTSMRVTWSKSINSDFSQYQVHMSKTEDFTPDPNPYPEGTLLHTYTDRQNNLEHWEYDLEPGTNYYFKLRVLDWENNYADSNQVNATTLPGPAPDPVTLYDPFSIEKTKMFLKWTPNVDEDFVRYEVHMSTTAEFEPDENPYPDGTLYEEIYENTTNITQVTGLSPLTTYFFKIRVVDLDEFYADSNEVNGTTLAPIDPPTPVNLSSPTDITKNSMKLNWTMNYDFDWDRYEVHKALTEDFIPNSSTLDQTIDEKDNLSTTVINLDSNTKYYFKIRTVDDDGLYADSNEVNAKTLPITALLPLGYPTQVIPRYITAARTILSFNMTPNYPNYYCAVTHDGDMEFCENIATISENCTMTGEVFPSPRLRFTFSDLGEYKYTVGSGEGIKPIITVGNLSIITPAGYGSAEAYDYGNLSDEDFLPDGLYLSITTNYNIDLQEAGNMVAYKLYRVDNCALKVSKNLTSFTTVNPEQNIFSIYLQKPEDCPGGGCIYMGEVVLQKGEAIGGAVFTFLYKPTTANFYVYPASADFGTLNQQMSATRILSLTNTGDVSITSIVANTTSPDVAYSLGKTTLAVAESTNLTLTLTAPSNVTSETFSENLTVIATSSKGDLTRIVPLSYKYEPTSGQLNVTRTSIGFGTLSRGDTKNETLDLTNLGPGTIDLITVVTPVEISRHLTEDSLGVNESSVLTLSLVVPSAALAGLHQDTVELVITTGTENETVALPINYTVSAPTTLDATVSPASWDAGSLISGSTDTQIFTVTVTGDTGLTVVTIEPTNDSSDILGVSPSTFSMTNGGSSDFTATLTAGRATGSHSGTIVLRFTKDSNTLLTKTVNVDFKIVENVAQAIDDARSRLNMLRARRDDLIAESGGPGTKLYKEIEANLTQVQAYLDSAEAIIDNAEAAHTGGDDDLAKSYLSDAQDDMNLADNLMDDISLFLEPDEKIKSNLTLFIIIGVVAGAIGAFLLALREGWIPIYKYPELSRTMKSIGLGFLVKKPVQLKPKPRFTPRTMHRGMVPKGAKIRPGAPPAAPSAPAAPAKKLTQAEVQKKWQAYYKTHPEYAKYVRQKYKSYYHRREK